VGVQVLAVSRYTTQTGRRDSLDYSQHTCRGSSLHPDLLPKIRAEVYMIFVVCGEGEA
jgi:hypothetical protein